MLVYDPAKDGRRRGRALRRGAGRRRRDRRPRRDPRARRRLRAVHAARASTSTTSSRCSRRARTSSRRAASSSAAATASATTAGRGSLDACARGGASIYATGSSPGFITDALPFALLSLQRRVDVDRDRRVRRTSRSATRRTCSSSRWASGGRSSRTTRAGVVPRSASSRPSLAAARRGRGPARRRVDVRRRGRGARGTTTSLAAGELPAGTVAAQRTTIVGTQRRRRGRALHARTGTARPTSSRRGTSGRRAGGCACAATRRSTSTSRFPAPLDELGSVTPAYTANRPVNAIPYVCAAPPGILPTADLPPITPAGPAAI